MGRIERMPEIVNGGLDPRSLTNTKLVTASHSLEVCADDTQCRLSHDPSNYFSDANGADTGVLVQGDEAAADVGSNGFWVHKFGAQPPSKTRNCLG